MKRFGAEIIGRTYTRGGIIFMVMGIDPYPGDRISTQHREKLLGLRPELLIAVPYRGTLIPNITVKGGVVRLTKVAVDGSALTGPKAISKALGITNEAPYIIRRLGLTQRASDYTSEARSIFKQFLI